MSKKHNIVPEKISSYCKSQCSSEAPIAEHIRKEAQHLPNSHMLVGEIIGSLLRIICSDPDTRHVLEVGTFLGYSAAMIAASLPKEAKLISIEEIHKFARIAKENLSKYTEKGKVEVIETEGAEWLDKYCGPTFDLIFLDARKEAFKDREEMLIDQLSIGGILVIDNSLARGKALHPEREWQQITHETNQKLSTNERLLVSLLPIRDGLIVARRVK